MKYLLFLFALVISTPLTAGDFVTARGMHFYAPGNADTPYRYVGTNFWYAPILASTGQGGDRVRLKYELDKLQEMGIDNLRILVGADAGSDSANTIKPVMQLADGSLIDTLTDGLDYLLNELEKRHMYAVLYLTNAWDWSGGYGFYLKRTGHGDSPNATGAAGYKRYAEYAAMFPPDTAAQGLFLTFVKSIVGRTNRYNGRPYAESPAIMAWQICNEPRPFSKAGEQGFVDWIAKTAKLIKQTDSNHLVSIGSEGIYGCNGNMLLYEQIHNLPEIDYLTIHVWPVNWGWSSPSSLYTSLPNVYVRTRDYVEEHVRMAKKIGKPLVIEEFGYPRDYNFRRPGSPTTSRDAFYTFNLDQMQKSKAEDGPIAGINFWGWAGSGRPREKYWAAGDDYLCDPPHEPQGWYSVFDCDASTLKLLSESAKIYSAR